jgi:hypothetical protein
VEDPSHEEAYPLKRCGEAVFEAVDVSAVSQLVLRERLSRDLRFLAPEEEWERQRRSIVVVARLVLRQRCTIARFICGQRHRFTGWVICGQWHRSGTRHWSGIGDRAAQHNLGVSHLLLLHQIPQRSGVLYRQPHAAVATLHDQGCVARKCRVILVKGSH